MSRNSSRRWQRFCCEVTLVLATASSRSMQAQSPHEAGTARSSKMHGASSSRQLDRIGAQLFELEKHAFDATAEGPFFQDPEDAQSTRAGFFSSSEKILALAVTADSGNSSAWYHWGIVAATRSELGFGNFDATLVRAAIDRLNSARARATTKEFSLLMPRIEKALHEQHRILASVK